MVFLKGVDGPIPDMEPITVRRLLPGLKQMAKLKETPASMVENAVQDDPDVMIMGHLQELLKGLIPAQDRIDGEIIMGVITMIGCRGKNGVQVKCIDAKINQVSHFIGQYPIGHRPGSRETSARRPMAGGGQVWQPGRCGQIDQERFDKRRHHEPTMGYQYSLHLPVLWWMVKRAL